MAVADPVVSLRDVVAVLGGFPALAGVTLDVDHGEILLLSGPNGAGKTTILRLCAGLVPVVRGSAVVLGHDLRIDREGVRPHVGLLGHQNGLYADLTVEENVRFWGSTVGASDAEIDSAIDRMDIGGRLVDVQVRRLSAGQRRRAALAGLIARRATLWLLDEPHAGLDAAGRDDLDATLRQAASSGATIIVASHELERAGSLATRTADVVAGQIDPGRLDQEDSDQPISETRPAPIDREQPVSETRPAAIDREQSISETRPAAIDREQPVDEDVS